MGLFSNLFSKRTRQQTTAARTDAGRKKTKIYCKKSQRFILDNVKRPHGRYYGPCGEKRGLQVKKEKRPHRRK